MQNPLSREELLSKYHEVFSGLGHIEEADCTWQECYTSLALP